MGLFTSPSKIITLALVLTSCKSRYYLHSSYRWIKKLRKLENHPPTLIHPETAEKHGIKEGDEIFVETCCGRITQVAHLTDTIHPGVIQAAYGWWFPEGDIVQNQPKVVFENKIYGYKPVNTWTYRFFHQVFVL